MKIKLLGAAWLLALAFPAFSQATWHELPSIPQSQSRYDDIFFLNPDLGWAADGWGSAVYKTTDGGQNWQQENVSTEEYYRNIEFLNENIGFLGSLSHNFYKTIDGGNTWTTVTNIPGDVPAICGLDAVGDHTIYGCGAYFGPAYVIKSVDSGNTWQYIDMSAYAEKLVEVLFVDENTGYASGSDLTGGVVLKTTNGGTSWTKLYSTGIVGEYVWKLQRLASNTQIMFGSVESVAPLNGKLIKSVDGGVNWVSKEVPDSDIQAVGFLTENHGWMGGHHTGFLETFDSGNTWIDTGLGISLNRIQFLGDNLAYCSGNHIYKFSDENLSISETAKPKVHDLDVKVHPNPLRNNLDFTVDFPKANHLIISIFDTQGKLVKMLQKETISVPGKKEYSFPFPYKAGAYFLSLHHDIGAQSVKLIKK
ncbi:hypothetical protein FNO01nite_21060 [Flavobacterium noncentrifugens]|uniref:Por secretion system C-terminal sorting domain-containing protein n=1 Tax=Flavobacterium noncentrifugens TaxID=1128970 RepID=A0A1G9AG50_9FLAO|nr:T9SS type A sorting domain-containing protein [Flavobacterium noncentrifugens]GEP51434.1 hypothetical protein FNO01nite_21060 [Flavobacterium noncentrifugens]SDK26248.1 Por secretion system C-terminal sorting domain-containing protein [Flavobacterium noncentrifugens]